MHLRAFSIKGLFGRFGYDIEFTPLSDRDTTPAVTILHGRNGAGKTTVLRMINGFMSLDFDIFREIPFGVCSLTFGTSNDTHKITVHKQREKLQDALGVSYKRFSTLLNTDHHGPLSPSYDQSTEDLRKEFFADTRSMDFDLIETTRLQEQQDTEGTLDTVTLISTAQLRQVRRSAPYPRPPRRRLAQEVFSFINEAQVDYRKFFATDTPRAFEKLMERLTSKQEPDPNPTEIRSRLKRLQGNMELITSSGLSTEEVDFHKLNAYLASDNARQSPHTLIVMRAFLELLEARSEQQLVIAARLRKFSRIMTEFLEDKRLEISSEDGFRIITDQGQQVHESQLSSGEYHLTFLMVRALKTLRRGSIIAIDEPELSMHISWQRQLIRALCECATGAQPQLIFATHSPDIAREYRDSMILLGREL